MTPIERTHFYEKRPLFERFATGGNTPLTFSAYHTVETLKQSVLHEIEHLLNEHTSPYWQGKDTFITPYAYGMRDIVFSRPQGTDFFQETYANYLQNLIAHYEPRLCNVQVQVDDTPFLNRCLIAHVTGGLSLNKTYYPVSFPVTINM
ncbi:MAG: hypothetical protein LBH38_01605 [Holosporales bacterium]|jgi:predicted component of type VI protein secretion system|nr:hypothetical protein [Holosporales bacterium]